MHPRNAYSTDQEFMKALRDDFAAKAMQGLMARIGPHEAALIAHDSYIVADAMIAERSKES